MKKSIVAIAYTVSLFGNVAPQAAEINPFQVVAEEQARQSVMAARHLIRAELKASMPRIRVSVSSGDHELAARFAIHTDPATSQDNNAISRTR